MDLTPCKRYELLLLYYCQGKVETPAATQSFHIEWKTVVGPIYIGRIYPHSEVGESFVRRKQGRNPYAVQYWGLSR
jgi:hypothetical protein